MLERIHLDPSTQGLDDAAPGTYVGLVRSYYWLIPDAELAQLRLAADPDGDVAPVPGDKDVGQAERRFFQQHVAGANRACQLFQRGLVGRQLSTSGFDEACSVAKEQA